MVIHLTTVDDMETKKRKLSADNRAKAKVKKGMSIKERVVILESNVLADLKNANDIITMLNMCDEGGETSYAALHALHRVFGKLYVGVSAKSAGKSLLTSSSVLFLSFCIKRKMEWC